MSPKRRIVQSVEGEKPVPGGRELRLRYRADGDEPVPAILLLPEGGSPSPAALLLHGYSSRKEEMASAMGGALLARGIASLAIDLPMHGTRADPLRGQAAKNPLGVLHLWRQSLADARLGLRYLAARPDVDSKRLAVVGYSLGSFLSVTLAADDPAVRAVVLAAGGDLPEGTAFTPVARLAADPMRAVRKLGGRPLLMVHGRADLTVRPEQAERLFAAAGEPKEIRWLDAGHRLPPSASQGVADWLAARLAPGRERDAG